MLNATNAKRTLLATRTVLSVRSCSRSGTACTTSKYASSAPIPAQSSSLASNCMRLKANSSLSWYIGAGFSFATHG